VIEINFFSLFSLGGLHFHWGAKKPQAPVATKQTQYVDIEIVPRVFWLHEDGTRHELAVTRPGQKTCFKVVENR
jgi:hypothetical protein